MSEQQVKEGTVENISHQKARAMVSKTSWNMIQDGKESYSKDMHWAVYACGQGMYRRRKVNPNW